ncbi:TlpA family protein disulfide reductase [Campylobacter sp. TTU-622]|uniref:TlpA family protein disulfide reductase n=1 Tax=unclassified Campylobacter TaxID=2593542 RepID=UPI001902F085|nr:MULTISPECIES: TlpA disulfide reductase family protein [unclassified Campylobacter]MBK1971608.1 TlpA family protein disulfide reductase [Campylobacter sp. TTU_617]MBK1973105.1 TlpA family protein disulfide reductase [Campylobacter sp. TTU-622]
MVFKKFFFLFLIFSLFFTACDKNSKKEGEQESAQKNISSNKSESKVNSFNLKMINGNLLSVKTQDDKIIFNNGDKISLFIFFTTWCQPCIAQIVDLNRFEEKYKQNLQIVGVLLEEQDKQSVETFIHKNKIKFDIAMGDSNYLLAKSLGGINGMPTLFLFDKDNNLIRQYLGLIPAEMLEIDIQKAID